MSKALANLELRPASLDDAAMVADLETARNPDEPRDPAMFRFWWSASPPDEVFTRQIAVRDGVAHAYLYAAHANGDLPGKHLIWRAGAPPESKHRWIARLVRISRCFEVRNHRCVVQRRRAQLEIGESFRHQRTISLASSIRLISAP